MDLVRLAVLLQALFPTTCHALIPGGPSAATILAPSAESVAPADAADLPAQPGGAPTTCHLGPTVTPEAFGARGGGDTDDTLPVFDALKYGSRCGATVEIGPAGRRFLVTPGAIRVELHGVVVRFTGLLVGPSLEVWNPENASWPEGSCAYGEHSCPEGGDGPSPEFVRSRWSLLQVENSSDVTLEGPQGLSAPGQSFWAVRNENPRVRGYCLLKIDRSQDVRLHNLTLSDSPMYHVVVMRARRVSMNGLQVRLHDGDMGGVRPHNTDGVSIIASHHVRIRNSVIESGDDNIGIKEGSRWVEAEGLRLFRGKGISIGSLGERGSEDQYVSDVIFRNVYLEQCAHGVRIKTWQGGSGLVRNASFESFILRDVAYGILIDQTYCPSSQRPEGCEGQDGVAQSAIRIEGVHYDSFFGTYVREQEKISCVQCRDVSFSNMGMHESALRSKRDGPAPVHKRDASASDA